MSHTLSFKIEKKHLFSHHVRIDQRTEWPISVLMPLEQFTHVVVPVRTSRGHIFKMVLIETVESQPLEEEYGPDAFELLFRISSFNRASKQYFYCHVHESRLSWTSLEETEQEIEVHKLPARQQSYLTEPDLRLFVSDLLRAKEIQQQAIVTWIMSARFAPLLIPRRDMQFKRSNTRAASRKKRKFDELQETSVYKWVANPLMDRNLIRLVLSFVK